MSRVVFFLLLVFAFSGASVASLVHGLNHMSHHDHHHAEMADADPVTAPATSLAECCDATGGMGSAQCFGDPVATTGCVTIAPMATMTRTVSHTGSDLSGRTPAVPTGPPKV